MSTSTPDPQQDPSAPTAPTPDQQPDTPSQPSAPDTPAPDQTPSPSDPQPQPETPAPAAPSQAKSEPTAGELEAELSRMRAQFDQLQQQLSSGAISTQPVDEELAHRVDELRQAFADWPQPGDKFADKPQPHELQKLGLPQPGVTRDHLPPGEPNTISPVVPSHNLPLIGPGQAGQPVSFLASLLHKVGYPTTISRGQNHSFSFDESVVHAVESFKRDWHVLEDSTGFRTAEEAARIVGPWIWEALLRATGTVAKAAA